jgi:A/G-specific adenine glycosylase
VEALAAAPDEQILSEWAGLGYYARARNLIACAREVARREGFPRTAAELRGLPGIGAYTSAAIAAIAFSEKAPAVDTNVERVIARVYAMKDPRRSDVERLFLAMMPDEQPGDYVQAMMDLGATICRPKAPSCSACPLKSDCDAAASGAPEAFPQRKAKARRPHRNGIAWWIERGEQVWLVRRPARGLLGGMAALPSDDWSAEAAPRLNPIGTVRHVFTHFSLDLLIVPAAEPVGDGWWHPIAELEQAGLPTLFRKAVELALGSRERLAA